MLILRLLGLPVRAATGTAGVAVRAGYRTGRAIGFRRVLVLATGVAVGLLVAPASGRDLRARARQALASRGSGDLATRVRAQLGSAQRTWHLPQPDVEVTGRRVVLRGEVPHETARQDLERVAAAVPGVAGVDNLLRLSAGPGTTATT